MSKLVTIQPANASHHNFIKSAWLKSYFNGKSSFCEEVTPDIFFKNHKEIVDKLLSRAQVLVAHSTHDPDVAVGYIVYEYPNTIHYAYVKFDFKDFGVATELFKATEIDPNGFVYTHRTRDCNWLIGYTQKIKINGRATGERVFVPGKLPKATYNPYAALKGE